jgi:hypothetical protein
MLFFEKYISVEIDGFLKIPKGFLKFFLLKRIILITSCLYYFQIDSKMGRFKAPAPAPPTPASRLKTPMKPPAKKVISELSIVTAFDDLMRNSDVFKDGAEQQFLLFVKNAKDWRKKWSYAETERHRLSVALNDREKELSGKDVQIKQAREMVNEERRKCQRAEDQLCNLQRQLFNIQVKH